MAVQKMTRQISLFGVKDITGELKPVVDSNTPLLHQKAYSVAQSAITLEKHTVSGNRKLQETAVRNYLFRHQGSKMREIKDNLVYLDKWNKERQIDDIGTISARLTDIRNNGYDLFNDKGKWSIVKRGL